MYTAKIIPYFISIITVFFWCILFAKGQSNQEENQPKNTQSSLQEDVKETTSSDIKHNLTTDKGVFTQIKDLIVTFKSKIAAYIPSNIDDENDREFDFSTNGDEILQNFKFFAKVPFNFKSYEVSVNGKYLQTYQKKEIPPSTEDIHPSEWKKLPKWTPFSKSYSFGIEAYHTREILNVFTLGGNIEYESDYSIVTDPRVHVSIFSEVPLWRKWNWINAGSGIWVEGQQLDTKLPELRSGLRFHIEIDSKYFNMVVECLPNWNFREYRVNVSPELIFEFKPFGKELSLVFHTEIDYYHFDVPELTVEPHFDIDEWDIRWTQLFRVPF
ncbi:hypothetical protein JT359_20380 [Candidatus Poribacteria bacterium]|nr:hypothetical protein [Candidatus Poribacteria bacterium]